MKIIKLSDNVINLTADNGFITSDNSNITVDQSSIDVPSHKIVIIPRIFPNVGDELILTVRNEITNVISNPPFTWEYIDNYFNLIVNTTNLDVDNKYELKVTREGVMIYKGKLLITDKTQAEIQNYQHTTITNNKIKF